VVRCVPIGQDSFPSRFIQHTAFDDDGRLTAVDRLRRCQPEPVKRHIQFRRRHAPVAKASAVGGFTWHSQSPLDEDVGQDVGVSRDARNPVLGQQLADFLRTGLPDHVQSVGETPNPRTAGVRGPPAAADQPPHGIEQVFFDRDAERAIHRDVIGLEVPFHALAIGLNGRNVYRLPTTREELIEDALRKIAVQQQLGFVGSLEDQPIFGVRFSLDMLRRELARHGHGIRHAALVESEVGILGRTRQSYPQMVCGIAGLGRYSRSRLTRKAGTLGRTWPKR
jgi:hypothetical protein